MTLKKFNFTFEESAEISPSTIAQISVEEWESCGRGPGIRNQKFTIYENGSEVQVRKKSDVYLRIKENFKYFPF